MNCRRGYTLLHHSYLASCKLNNILYIFVEIFVLISYVGGQGELYCSYETLYSSILNPTVYTQITGNTMKYNNYIMSVYLLLISNVSANYVFVTAYYYH